MSDCPTVKDSPDCADNAHFVLTLDHITHYFGTKCAVDNVSLSVSSCEILGLVGPSGCGKTTLLRIIAGLEAVQSGTLCIDSLTMGKNNKNIPPEDRNIGLVFQDYALFPHLSVLDNIRFGLWRLPRMEQEQRAMETLRQIELVDYAQAYPHQLSGGQRQRVALARALAPRPSVLLLDEPFSGLNVQLRHAVREETLEILRRHNLIAIIVTHDPQEAMYLGDRVAVMNKGKIVQYGTPTELYEQPINRFVARFFSQVNQIRGRIENGTVRTPFGPIRVGYDPCGCCLSDGKPVEVLIRPEGLSVNSHAPGEGEITCQATVERICQIGSSNLIHLRIEERNRVFHFMARTPGTMVPSIRQHVELRLDARQAFVFPLEPCAFD